MKMEEKLINDIKEAHSLLEQKLLAKRNSKGIWEGRLSSSALSTAVAVFGLHSYEPEGNSEIIDKGLKWLKDNVNADGGFGDTIVSSSNLSTTLLCWSALSIVKEDQDHMHLINRVEQWLTKKLGGLEPEDISNAILRHYSADRTFSVPILAMCALSGRLGPDGWKYVPQLPFQFAVFPDRLFKWLNLSVVSYAIPALISMGLAKQHNHKPGLLIRMINKLVIPKVLKILAEKQPANGGFLEATPLTGFVLMTLVGAGQKDNIVCNKAERFLQMSIRPDGSWPIDTSLTTWVTTLSINALSDETFIGLDNSWKSGVYNWLLQQQHRKTHPFTKSKPGGWAWIDTEGGVPDGDDTSGALLAIHRLSKYVDVDIDRVSQGINWLINNQNSDGGFPTFCKGWGKLPFDASCADITSHAMRAMLTWKEQVSSKLSGKIKLSVKKSILFLQKKQRTDGSWLPLWFGNENDKNHQNPVYGTSLVLIGLLEARKHGIPDLEKQIESGINFLESAQNDDGGWGANVGVRSSIEETSLALRALRLSKYPKCIGSGTKYLLDQIEKYKDSDLPSEPIGLYFASLWYFEEMYGLVFALNALYIDLQKS